MKHNHEGKAYRNEIEARIALFEGRQPPFDDIPPGEFVVSTGNHHTTIPQNIPQNIPQITSGNTSGVIPETRVNQPSVPFTAPHDTVPHVLPHDVPSEFAAARAMSDVDVINRLSLNMA